MNLSGASGALHRDQPGHRRGSQRRSLDRQVTLIQPIAFVAVCLRPRNTGVAVSTYPLDRFSTSRLSSGRAPLMTSGRRSGTWSIQSKPIGGRSSGAARWARAPSGRCRCRSSPHAAAMAESVVMNGVSPYGPIRPTKDETTGLELLKLPEGFRYWSYSWTGDEMSDGVRCPNLHDGMAVVDDWRPDDSERPAEENGAKSLQEESERFSEDKHDEAAAVGENRACPQSRRGSGPAVRDGQAGHHLCANRDAYRKRRHDQSGLRHQAR